MSAPFLDFEKREDFIIPPEEQPDVDYTWTLEKMEISDLPPAPLPVTPEKLLEPVYLDETLYSDDPEVGAKNIVPVIIGIVAGAGLLYYVFRKKK
jgi:LPXTG-motif cell wall-anchored protein